MLRIFVTMAIVGGLAGYLNGKYRKWLMRFGLVGSIICGHSVGVLLVTSAAALARNMSPVVETAAVSIGLTAFCIVIVVTIYFDDDDRWKRFRKKTSERLRKLLEKVKEAVPSPAPRPA